MTNTKGFSMIRKTFFHLLFLSTFMSNSHLTAEPTKPSAFQIQFYKKNDQWKLLEKTLIEEFKKENSKTGKNVNNVIKGMFLAPLIVLNCIGIAYGSIDITTFNGVLEMFGINVIASVFSGMGAAITKSISHAIYGKKIESERLINVLESFLQNYNPDLNHQNKDGINHKQLIPQEYHGVFDELHYGYLESGRTYLEENIQDIMEVINSIKEKIMYEIKPQKYAAKERQVANARKRLNAARNAMLISGAIVSTRRW